MSDPHDTRGERVMDTVRLTRRAMLGVGGACTAQLLWSQTGCSRSTPAHLRAHQADYADNPRAASVAWFRQARFGLFMHYGLYSQVGRGEWVMLLEKIPVAEYAKL